MSRNGAAPVIIKRKKVIAGDGHHGGAWKVAYADFVTAMMAFFMLMWLLNATTEKQRKGIADYFSPTIPVNRISGGGDGALGGDSVFTEESFARNGTGASNTHTFRAPQTTPPARPGEADVALRALEAALLQGGGEQLDADDALQHIATRITDEGLVIELYSRPGKPLFREDDNSPTPLLEQLIGIVAGVVEQVTNPIAVEGHSRAFAAVLQANPAWDVAQARVAHVRNLLGSELAGDRIVRLTSHGAREPVGDNPMAVRNDRVEMILIRSDK